MFLSKFNPFSLLETSIQVFQFQATCFFKSEPSIELVAFPSPPVEKIFKGFLSTILADSNDSSPNLTDYRLIVLLTSFGEVD